MFGYVFVLSTCSWQLPSEQNYFHLIHMFVVESALRLREAVVCGQVTSELSSSGFAASEVHPAAADAAVCVPDSQSSGAHSEATSISITQVRHPITAGMKVALRN